MDIPQIKESPAWRQIALHPTGGLTEVGLSSDEKFLLVVSHAGRGVISTSTGERVALDYDVPRFDSEWIQEDKKLVRGVGPVKEEWISVVGLWGGQLAIINPRQWTAHTKTRDHREFAYIRNTESNQQLLVDTPVTEVRAFGFSESGRFLIFATSSDAAIYENAA